MTDKAPFDLDAALAALVIDERATRPAVSESLKARVLGDAAMVAAPSRTLTPTPTRTARSGGFRLFGLLDVWSGAAVAAVGLCLVIGLGVGYGARPEVLAQVGLGDVKVAVAAEEGDGLFLSEGML